MADATLEVMGGEKFSDDVKRAIAKWAEAVSETVKLLHNEGVELTDDESAALYEMPLTAAAAIHAPGIALNYEHTGNPLASTVGLLGAFADRLSTQIHNFNEQRAAAAPQKH